MENIYTQAVADAKAVRESAMANAKAAIQEAFEPKIKAMLKKHIVENEGLYEGSFTIDYNDADYIQDLFDQAGINAMAKQGLDSEEVEIHGDAKSLKAAKLELGKEGFEIGGCSDKWRQPQRVGMSSNFSSIRIRKTASKSAVPNRSIPRWTTQKRFARNYVQRVLATCTPEN